MSIPLLTLLFIKKIDTKFAGNFFSLSNVLAIALASALFIFPPLPEINFVQGLYLILGLMPLTLLFANKRVLVLNSIIALLTNFWYYQEITSQFGPNPVAEIGVVTFPFALIILSTVIFFGKKFFEDAMKLSKIQSDEKDIQNDKLEELLNSVKETSVILEELAEKIKSSANELNKSNSNQATNIEQISVSIEEVVNSIIQNSENAKQTSEVAENASSMSEKSLESLRKVLLTNIEMNKKIELVNEIAFKTNLLSLNAAIEASHSGDLGKGFAVVATEIKKLSLHSKKSAQEIISMISENIKVTDVADSNLKNILTEIKKSAEYSVSISEALAEQEQSIRLINKAMEDVNISAQNNVSVSDNLNSNIELLFSQSSKLKNLLSN